ncbi:MAG: DUF1732 domain-containing protein [Candidatus Cloacimonadaceae bacterium]|jgi:uncharacterized protein (TIGR00255 family)|nr:DUF1732 domain-containing protein [Candidatus Cloacimonadaceae bacterium]
MISMTGFGKSHRNLHNIECDIEIKSVNGRYLDIKCYLPRELSFYEFSIRKTTSRYLSRGSIEIRVNINDYREPKVLLNEPKLRKYHDIIKQAQNALGIEQNVSLEFLLNEPGVIESVNRLDDDPLMLEVLELTLSEALETAKLSMRKEADAIRCHLINSFQAIESSLITVGQQIQPFKDELFSNLYKRINEILASYNIDTTEQRLMQELAIYIDKYDIQEELTRLSSHIKTFYTTIDKDDEIGKTLNFILQEMQREANTLGSKFSNSKTFQDILVIKEEIEKCREIVQNVS